MKLLGVPWNKNVDTIQVNFPSPKNSNQERSPQEKPKIYDPLELVL